MKKLYEAVGIVWEKKAAEPDPEILKIYAEDGFENDYLESLEAPKVEDYPEKFLVEEDLKRLRGEFFEGKPEGFSVDSAREFLRLWEILEIAGRHFFAVCPDFPRVAKMEDFIPELFYFHHSGWKGEFLRWERRGCEWVAVFLVDGVNEEAYAEAFWRVLVSDCPEVLWKREIGVLMEFLKLPDGVRPIDYEWREWIESVIEKAAIEIEKMAALMVWDE